MKELLSFAVLTILASGCTANPTTGPTQPPIGMPTKIEDSRAVGNTRESINGERMAIPKRANPEWFLQKTKPSP